MPSDAPRAEDWPDDPDAWADADRAWRAGWEDADEVDPEAGGVAPYVPPREPATARGVGQAYGAGMREAGPYLGLGVQIAASMAVFVGGGLLLDRWLGSEPWGVLGGAALGMLSIVALLVRLVKLMSAGDPTRTAPPPKRNGASG